MSDFYKYFPENMEAMGAPAPEHLFGNVSTALATTTTLVSFIDKFGSRVTVIEMIKAGTMKDRALLLLAGVFIACFSALTWRYLGEYTLLLILAFPLIDALIDHRRQRRSRASQENTEHKNQTPER